MAGCCCSAAHSMMKYRTPSTDGAFPFAVGYREENPLSGIIILCLTPSQSMVMGWRSDAVVPGDVTYGCRCGLLTDKAQFLLAYTCFRSIVSCRVHTLIFVLSIQNLALSWPPTPIIQIACGSCLSTQLVPMDMAA